MLAAACSDAATPIALPSADAPAVFAATPVQRPISGHCETQFNPPPFSPPAVHRQIDTGTCQLAHLGRTDFHSVKDLYIFAGTVIVIETTFTAANGDIVRAEGSGTSTLVAPGEVAFTSTLTIVGGTGRFANATGELKVEGEANSFTGTAFVEITGWMRYSASDRSSP